MECARHKSPGSEGGHLLLFTSSTHLMYFLLTRNGNQFHPLPTQKSTVCHLPAPQVISAVVSKNKDKPQFTKKKKTWLTKTTETNLYACMQCAVVSPISITTCWFYRWQSSEAFCEASGSLISIATATLWVIIFKLTHFATICTMLYLGVGELTEKSVYGFWYLTEGQNLFPLLWPAEARDYTVHIIKSNYSSSGSLNALEVITVIKVPPDTHSPSGTT